MDNSPTTGSVSTTVAEKQKLARASLAFNCKSPMFRKMFPEYVELYNQLQNAEKLNSDRVAEKEQTHAAFTAEGKEKEEDNRVLDKRNQRHTNKIPFWLLFFIFSVLCAIMALPLLLI
ncbi:unnamed protein product [Victoria cruziana]